MSAPDGRVAFNANKFPEIYKDLGIDLGKLGCVMLDVDPKDLAKDLYLEQMEERDVFYSSEKPDRFWIDGYVAGKTAHVTLLYGLLTPAWKQKGNIEKVLAGWSIKTVHVESIGFFPSPYPDDPYYCIVAHVEITPELREGNERLELLPHINTFPGYKAHISLAYVKKDEEIRDWVITNFESWLPGRDLRILPELNLGSEKK